jgi:serine/threonine protein kinase/tetratricopeptide (TPR) repeat protein
VLENDDDKTRTFVPLTKDTMVSHYRIIEKIGAGGMGEVYLAEDTKLDRKVALKFLPPHLCQDPDCRSRFKREAQAAAKLNHPNIVTIYEVAEFNGRPFLVMEHLEGETLRELIKQKDMPLSQAIQIAIQLCEGIQEAHAKGVIHRDIKPGNITCDSKGHCKILDFGLAAVRGTEKLTKSGSTMGTLHYMSPEQSRGEVVDERSDIFSLGVVLYEMVTGQLPFKGDHDPATIYSIGYENPEPLARYKSGVSNELQRVITKALTKQKDERYQHADELAADLKQLLSPSGPLLVKRSRRMRIVVPLLIVIVLSAIALVFKPWELVRKSSDETTAKSKRVVVVPFRNQTGDPSLDPLGKMVADWTTQGLLQTGLAEVVLPQMLSDLDASKGVRSVVDATGATLLVTGSYYKVGDSIQFQAQVMKADGNLLQAIEPIYASTESVMDGVEAVRQQTLGALALELDYKMQELGSLGPRIPKYEAYQEYIRGVDLFLVKSDMGACLEPFSRAYNLDTSFMPALFFKCCAYFNLSQYDQADSLLRFLSQRRASLGRLQLLSLDELNGLLSGNLAQGLSAVRQAGKLAPRSIWVAEWGSVALVNNRPRECIEALKGLGARSPWVFYWTFLAQAYHLLGEHEKELESAREGRRHFPTSSSPYYRELCALAAMERMDELRELIEEQTTLRGISTPAGVRCYAAEELRAHGHEDEAMTLLDQAIRWYESQSPEKLDSLRESYALTLNYARRWDKAKIIYEELAKKFPKDSAAGWRYESVLGIMAARQGDRTRAMEVSEWLKNLKLPYLFGANTYQRACIAAILGDKEQAVALLKESFLQGSEFGIGVHKDLDLESLWDYPPFIEFLKPKG